MSYSYLSDIGRKRTMNQDYVKIFLNQQRLPLYLLADGMGGHQAGEVASKLTVETLGARFTKTEFQSIEEIGEWLTLEIKDLNHLVFEQGQLDDFRSMGTTLEALLIFSNELILAHVGDSRSYLLRNGDLTQLTEDHSLVNELRLMGEITEEEAAHHPRKNIITRSIGMPKNVEVDLIRHKIADDDLVLICSDGLFNMLEKAEIIAILAGDNTLDEKALQLVEQANANGGSDNISVLLIDGIKEEHHD
ncbi:MAG: Stp1/IreP family PP2C-type Ser/Thr phosphatase [Streptococcaceae bacterium]|jgi:protein phosphatase|nr:Stp1/IreP family PP2C-type Ser/Thr phosphatase [Streptococcaceae bacterium]